MTGVEPGLRGQDAAAVVIQGAVSCDTAVNVVDSLQILRSVAGLGTSAACLAESGDVNCDAAVNSTDALRILQYIAGLSNTAPPGCTPIGEAIGPAPSSFDFIAAAFAAHEINDEQALLYRMYASFGDSRLPPQYKGDDSGVFENPAMGDLPDAWAGLSQATKDILAPFLLTPPEPGSWFELQGGGAAAAAPSASEWATISPPTAKAKVWYHPSHSGDAATAQKYADALEGTIWPNLTQLMGRPPLPDCGAACPSGGGDDRFDIYIVNENVRSYTKWNTPGDVPACKKTPAVMVIRRNASLATLAHEFMHAVQYAFGLAGTCSAYDWFAEASAQWAMDYVYPSGPPGGPPNEEQQAAPWMLDEPSLMLNYKNDSHEYGAYLFPFYLARMKGQPLIVRTIWENFETTAKSLEAINDALLEHLLGSFEEVWPKVALYDWNRPPVDDYKNLDELATGADTVDHGVVAVTLGGPSSRDFEVSADVDYLGALYHHFQFADPSVHSVVFDNSAADYPHAAVWALVKIGGEWKDPEDWTHDEKKFFCRDIDSQHVEELVLIISYSNWEDEGVMRPAGVPKLTARSAGCTDWVGTATVTTEDTIPGGHAVVTLDAQVRFKDDTPLGTTMCADPGTPPPACERYSVSSGKLTYSYVSQAGDCTWTIGPGTVSLPHTPPEQGGDGVLVVYTGANPPSYYGGGSTFFMDTMTVACGETTTYPSEAGGIWFNAALGMFTVKNHGHTIDDTYTEGNTTWHWHFDPAPPE
jgi:hypothetical protein